MTTTKKYALITGGSRGIGKAACESLAEAGYHILINYRSNDEEAKKTMETVKSFGVDCELLKYDISSAEETDAVLGKWIDQNEDKVIEVLVNNAGIRKDVMMMMMPKEDWDSVLNISVNGFFNTTKMVLKNMLVNRFGRIINVVSLSGIKGLPGQANYSASKGAVIGATKALAQEVGRRGITVNAVAPGFIKTDMTQDIKEEDYKKVIPVGRFGESKEVADLIAFLASPKASYITGEVICITGGLY